MGLMPGVKDIVDNDEKIEQPETQQSMDLNKPVSNPSMSELGEPSENPFSQEKVPIPECQGGQSVNNSKAGSMSLTEPVQSSLCASLDLSLKLSPAIASQANEYIILGGSVFPLLAHSVTSLGPNARGELDSSGGPEIPTLILKGCPRCHMHVMVPKTDQKCPKCGSYELV